MAEKSKPSSGHIEGAGATAAGVGYLAAGNPTKKKVSLEGVNFTEKPKNTRQLIRDKAVVARRMSEGGVLGFRTTVHEGGLYGFKQAHTRDQMSGAAKDAHAAFRHGRNLGKIEPEVRVIRHMKGGRLGGHLLAAGGVGAIGYGAAKGHYDKKRQMVAKRSQEANDRLLGAGVAGAGVSAGGSALLSSQKRKWAKEASRAIDQGGRLAPATAGRKKRFGRLTMDPKVTDGQIVRQRLMHGLPLETAHEVGRLRGDAAQARHFSHVYGNAGKGVAIAGGLASGAAIHSALKQKNKVSKARNLSQTQIDRRKRAGAELTRVTSAIGLGSLALVGAGAAAPKLARAGKLTRIAPKLTPEKAEKFREATKNKAITAGIVSSGIGGFNGFNNAAWQGAEARQRKKAITKSAFEDGFYGTVSKRITDAEIEEEVAKISAKTKFATGYHQGMLEQGHLTRIKSKSYRTGEKVGHSIRRAEQTLAKLPIKKSDKQSAFGVVHD